MCVSWFIYYINFTVWRSLINCVRIWSDVVQPGSTIFHVDVMHSVRTAFEIDVNPMQIHYLCKTIRIPWKIFEKYTCLFHIDSSFFIFCFAQLNQMFKLAFSDHLLHVVNSFVRLQTLFYIFDLFFRNTGLNLTKLDTCTKHSYAFKENS